MDYSDFDTDKLDRLEEPEMAVEEMFPDPGDTEFSNESCIGNHLSEEEIQALYEWYKDKADYYGKLLTRLTVSKALAKSRI